jgi:pseudaminic acid biosynthesis-associated methylase
MAKQFRTEQEAFWAGEFGNDYVVRNNAEASIANNRAMFSRILARCPGARSLIEFGSNIGMNLRAIRTLLPQLTVDAIEINESAVKELTGWGGVRKIYHHSILEFKPEQTYDISLIAGVLIHINPDALQEVYDKLFRTSSRYVVLVEYYNPSPVEIPYRGHSGRLFKRDFAGEMLDKFPSLRVVDYGFVWRRDPVFPQDDPTWFVLEKSG